MKVEGKWYTHESTNAIAFAIGPISLMTVGRRSIWISAMQEDFYKVWTQIPWDKSGSKYSHHLIKKTFIAKIII
jgi:hypothetical protein